MKRIVFTSLAILTLCYAAAVVALRVSEPRLVFRPGFRQVEPPSPSFELRHVPVRIPTPDSLTLGAWIVPAAQRDSSGMWLLICHGNYGNIGYGQRPEFYSYLRDVGVNLLAFDYRGFGESDGVATERGVYTDARAAYDYLRDSLGVPAERIILFGHSLGSSVAIELAQHVPAAGLVVEGAFTSVVDRGAELYPYLPVRLVAASKFGSIERVPKLKLPKLFLHSPEDRSIPFAHGQRLFAAASEPKRFVEVRGGHIEAFTTDRAVYFGAIATFVREVAGSM
jgi:fermentation-respiration switch protein FrsA (DUF1100 family)